MNYALGVNPLNRSFMCGSATIPRSIRTTAARIIPTTTTFPIPPTNRHTIYGALVGGPDSSDNYTDDRDNYVNNEVACDYNAGFTGALAGLYERMAATRWEIFPWPRRRRTSFSCWHR